MPSPTTGTAWKYSADAANATVDALLAGTQWSNPAALTVSYPGFGSTFSTSANGGYGPNPGEGEPWSEQFDVLTSSDISAMRSALRAWAEVCGLAFQEVAESDTLVGDIRAAYTAGVEMGDAQAYAYFPASGPRAGDIWFNTLGTSYSEIWSEGSWEYQTAVHEIGHAIGLKHPFSASSLNPTVIPAAYDSRSYTIMSYSAQPGFEDSYFNYEPTTPMVLDVAAVQHLYGIDSSTNAGNNTYSFVGTGLYHRTIWDAGGIDTISYSAATGGEIDLTAGLAGGSALGEPLQVLDSWGNVLYTTYNVYIASGAVIENAIGGNGNDTIIGNAAANSLSGSGGGADNISAGGGSDTLDGGAGIDTLAGGSGNDRYVIGTLGDKVVEASGQGSDTVVASYSYVLGATLESLMLGGTAAVNGTGNALANVLTGNSAVNSLSAGGGNDKLDGRGGNDVLVGGAGLDVFQFTTTPSSTANADRVTDLSVVDDRIQLENAVYKKLVATGTLSAAYFRANLTGTAVDANDYVLYDTNGGQLWYDADGSGAGARVLVATLSNLAALTAADLFVS